MRVAAALGLLLLAAPTFAQTFRPANGPWTREHRLVGSAPDGRIFAAVGTRLAETRDGGLSWTVLSESDAPARIAADGPTLFGAFSTGVRRSDDGGRTWTPWGLDGREVTDIAADAGRAYATTGLTGTSSTEAYIRQPGGDWSLLPVPSAGPTRIGTISARGAVIAIGGERTSTRCPSVRQGMVLRSRDGGQTWDAAEAGAFTPLVAVAPSGVVWSGNSSAEVCSPMQAPEYAPALFRWMPAAAGPTFALSTRGGLALGADGQPVHSLPEDGAPLRLSRLEVAGGWVIGESVGTASDCGIDSCTLTPPSGLYTARGGRSMSVGFEPSAVRALAERRDTLIAAADGAVFGVARGTRGADRWTRMLPFSRVRVLQPFEGSVLAVSTDTGLHNPPAVGWIGPVPAPFQGQMLEGGTSAAVAFGQLFQVVGSEGGGFCRVTRTRAEPPGSFVELSYSTIGSVSSAAGAAFAGVVGTPEGPDAGTCHYSQTPAPAVLLRLDAPGGAWTPDASGLDAAGVYDVADVPATDRLAAGTTDGVFGRGPGEAWVREGLAGRTVRVLHAAEGSLYAGTDAGLFRRATSGAWVAVAPEIAGRTVYALVSGTADGEPWIAAGTDRGVWTTTARFVDAEPASGAQTRLAVRVSPNPGSGERRVAVSQPARVRVYDALGRLVADLGDVALEASWTDARLPAGVYVVRAEAGGAAATVRLSVAR